MREATAQAKTIFLEALEHLGRADMLRYLDQACGDNVALRTRVEELLNAHEDAGSFLEARRPSLDATVDDPHVVERPGVVVGPYKLMEQIGEGGMGLVSSGWHSDRVRLWNAATGTLVYEWITGMARVYFTPDSRELIVCRAEEFTFYDTKTLKQTRRIRRDVTLYPGHVAHSPDGGLMALEMAPGIVHLLDAASGKIVARLEDPHRDRASWMSFTAEGTQLVVTAPYARAIHVWDLRAIRQRLKTMNLDWDWPEFRAVPAPAKAARPPKVEVLMGDVQRNPRLNK